MFSKTIIFGLVTFFHDLFTAVWIGGMFTLGLTVMPSAKKVFGKGPQTKKLMNAIQKRHSVWVYVSMVGLILTGLLQSNRSLAFSGLFSFQDAYSAVLSIKHVFVLAMIAIALYRSLGLKGTSNPSQEKLKARLLILNIILGVGVLLLSGMNAALSSGIPPA